MIDIICILGGIILAGGVYLEFGIGFSLIVFGLFMIKFALISAYIRRDAYVSDDNEEE
jgi:hypothetical protein